VSRGTRQPPVSVGRSLYNPDWLTDDDVVAGFIARRDVFDDLRAGLTRTPVVGNAQHYLLVGVRGAGKTTLLKRLAVAIRRDAELALHLIALSFPEELYQVKHLADFWWATVDALADALEQEGRREESDALAETIESRDRNRASEAQNDDAGLKCLLEACAALGRRPVLLVDNLDFVMRRIDKQGRKLKNPDSTAYWALREALSTTHSPVVIGGSVRLSEPFIGHDKAFYDFFLPKRLGKLDLEEVNQILRHLAEVHGEADLRRELDEHPGRIRALYDLTGANPRAIGIVFELVRQGPSGRAVDDFERLLDLTTPYYKARFEDLPEQAQVVMHALATTRPEDETAKILVNFYGHTAAAVSRRAGLETRVVSAQLEKLINEGVVEKEGGGRGQGKMRYRIAEQLFRIWIQMRTNRRLRLNTIWLSEFLEAFWEGDALRAAALDEGDGPETRGRARFMLAVSQTSQEGGVRRVLESRAADTMLAVSARGDGEFREAFAPGDLSERVDAHMVLREDCQKILPTLRGLGADVESVCDGLFGALRWTSAQKRALVDRLGVPQEAPAALDDIRAGLHTERTKLFRDGFGGLEIERLYELRRKGLLSLPGLRPSDVSPLARGANASALRLLVWKLLTVRQVGFADDAAADAWLVWARKHFYEASGTEWAALTRAFRGSKRVEAAAAALVHSFERGESARGWCERAVRLDEVGRDSVGAEAAYRHAMTLDEADAWPWNGLGDVLAQDPMRLAEAEAAYRQAITVAPADKLGWSNLGYLLSDDSSRRNESEVAYRRAIALDPTDAWPWSGLGCLLSDDPSRLGEAETAYRRSSTLDPTFSWPWTGLGNLLFGDRNRLAEGEAAYRRAIELDPTDAWPWCNLGEIVQRMPGRAADAEAAFRQSISLDPEFEYAWLGLGRVLSAQPANRPEAVAALAKAIELDPSLTYAELLLNDLRAQAAIRPISTALEARNWPAVEGALLAMAADREQAARTFAAAAFIDRVVARAFHAEQGAKLLEALTAVGFMRYAAPLYLALDAAVGDASGKLMRAPPEVRSAAFKLYERILNAPLPP
jgi:tetratricopeptide (TPR) repeat protein